MLYGTPTKAGTITNLIVTVKNAPDQAGVQSAPITITVVGAAPSPPPPSPPPPSPPATLSLTLRKQFQKSADAADTVYLYSVSQADIENAFKSNGMPDEAAKVGSYITVVTANYGKPTNEIPDPGAYYNAYYKAIKFSSTVSTSIGALVNSSGLKNGLMVLGKGGNYGMNIPPFIESRSVKALSNGKVLFYAGSNSAGAFNRSINVMPFSSDMSIVHSYADKLPANATTGHTILVHEASTTAVYFAVVASGVLLDLPTIFNPDTGAVSKLTCEAYQTARPSGWPERKCEVVPPSCPAEFFPHGSTCGTKSSEFMSMWYKNYPEQTPPKICCPKHPTMDCWKFQTGSSCP